MTDGDRVRLPDASAGVASPVGADFRSHMTRVSERAVSHGHADRFDGIIWTNDAARAAWPGASDMPDGAILVEEAIERTVKGDRAAGLLVMEKRDQAWHFVLVDEHDHAVESAREAACVQCHREAPRDFVFRRESAPPTPAPAASK